MNIGIILWSQTGNTYSVAEKIKEKLDAAGHSVNIERIKIAGEFKPGKKDIQFETLPDVAQYDRIVFGAPVQAFSLSQVMTRYLKQLPSLKNKKVALYLTKQLRFNWTGGNQAINKMKKFCTSKDGTICGSGIVIWSSPNREQMIAEVAERISKLF
ncbi:MAG: flavodoxin domain-containing protein [candidate division WOR-3 bacterium]|nr:flavodoxin domain-containing protein [candidate division WOR-3 bacterium]